MRRLALIALCCLWAVPAIAATPGCPVNLDPNCNWRAHFPHPPKSPAPMKPPEPPKLCSAPCPAGSAHKTCQVKC